MSMSVMKFGFDSTWGILVVLSNLVDSDRPQYISTNSPLCRLNVGYYSISMYITSTDETTQLRYTIEARCESGESCEPISYLMPLRKFSSDDELQSYLMEVLIHGLNEVHELLAEQEVYVDQLELYKPYPTVDID